MGCLTRTNVMLKLETAGIPPIYHSATHATEKHLCVQTGIRTVDLAIKNPKLIPLHHRADKILA